MDAPFVPPIIATFAALGIFLFFFGIYSTITAAPSVEDRIRRYGGSVAVTAPQSARGGRGRGRGQGGSALAKQVGNRLASGKSGAKLARDLARADIQMTASEFVTLNLVCVLGMAVLGFLIVRSPIGAIVLGILGYFAPRFWLGYKRRKRVTMFNSQLPDAITLLANSMRSGYSLAQAMDLLSRDGRPPISDEFQRVNREVGLGLPPQEAMQNMMDRVPSEDLDLMVTAININREVGGNLAEVLDAIADTIRDRIKLFGEVKVLTAQQTISGYVISALPILLGCVLFMINPVYFGVMFNTVCGWIALTCSAAGITSGFFVMKKITNIKV